MYPIEWTCIVSDVKDVKDVFEFKIVTMFGWTEEIFRFSSWHQYCYYQFDIVLWISIRRSDPICWWTLYYDKYNTCMYLLCVQTLKEIRFNSHEQTSLRSKCVPKLLLNTMKTLYKQWYRKSKLIFTPSHRTIDKFSAYIMPLFLIQKRQNNRANNRANVAKLMCTYGMDKHVCIGLKHCSKNM